MKLKKVMIAVVVLAAVCLAGFLAVNQNNKNRAVEAVARNLPNMVIQDMEYTDSELHLHDPVNNKDYTFYGALSSFVFHDDGTVTWIRQFDRSCNKGKWTEPIVKRLGYEVVYLGEFLCDNRFGIFLKMETGEILQIRFSDDASRAAGVPTSIDYNILRLDTITAPAELMGMDTSFVNTGADPYYVYTPDPDRCSTCMGTGRVVLSYGNRWNDEEGYGYGDVCGSCGGTGHR